MALDETAPLPEADALGERYVLEQLIGEGAFARTYRARDTRLARVVAVKLLRSHYAADPSFLDRFRREARSAAKVDHPNVVHVYDYGGHEGAYFLVLQYVPGQDLKRLIEENAPLPPEDAIRITREILSGLAAIHAAGIIHRDIKPQNVLIGWDGVSRVTDFGIAYENGQSRLTGLTDHGTTLGTPAYMAPEQARGEPVSAATDLYAVGVVLFELLTGRLPFEAESTLAMMVAHVEQPPPPPSTIQPGVPPELDAIVLRALAKSPGSRYGDTREMERALVDALIQIRGESPMTRRIPTSSRVRAAGPARDAAAETAPIPSYRPPAPPAPPPATAHGGREPKRRRSGWVAPALLAVIALSVLIAALVKATGDPNDAGNTPRPTRTPTELAAALGPGTETPEPTATHRVINWPNPTENSDPTRTPPRPTRTPKPTQEPTQTSEPTAEDSNGGVPTIAPSGGGGVTKAPTETPETDGGDIQPVSESFSASDWQGGLTRTDSGFLGRPWTAVYGAQSGYGQASLTFSLDAAPTSDATLTITGVDDEAGGDSPISITVNGTEVFSGPSPFPSWDGSSADGPWTAVPFSIPARLLQAGTNQITVSNLNPSGATNSPPYVLLSDAILATE